MRRTSATLALAVLAASGALANMEWLRIDTPRSAISPEELKRKLTKAEKKRAKRAARNLRLTQREEVR